MADNQYVNRVDWNGGTLIDLTTDDVSRADVALGKVFHLPSGEQTTGTASGGSAYIVVTSVPTAVLTCDSQTYTLGADETRHAFSVALGTHTVTATYDSKTATRSVVVSDYVVYFADITSFPRIPSIYQEVEWIGGTGTQYINTGQRGNSAYKYVLEMAMNDVSSIYTLFGARDASTGFNAIAFWFLYTTSAFVRADFQNQIQSINTATLTSKHKYEFNANKIYVDDTLAHTFTTSSFTTTSNLMLMGLGLSDGTLDSRKAKAKLYSYKAYNTSSTLLQDYVPCYRISDGVIGMYDLVTESFKTNAGTGTFTKGADVT